MSCNKVLLIVCSISTMFTWGQELPKQWSLKQCIDYAIAHNIRVKQQALSLEDAALRIKDAKGAFLPNLNASAGNTWNNSLGSNNNGAAQIANAFNLINANIGQLTQAILSGDRSILETEAEINRVVGSAPSRATNRNSNFRIQSNIPIFNGMRNLRRLEQAKMQNIANTYDNERLKDDIRLQIANSYLEALLLKANIDILKSQNEITKQQIDRTSLLIDSGNLPKGDVLELKATSAAELQNIISVENRYLISLLNIKQQLNLKLSQEFQISEIEVTLDDLNFLSLSPNDFIAHVTSTRNEIKLAEKSVEISEKNIELAKGNYYPTVSGAVNASTSEFDTSGASLVDQLEDNFRYNYGVSVNIPIFNRHQNQNAVSRAKVAKMRSEYDLEITKQRLRQNVYQAYLDAQASQKSLAAAEVAEIAQKTAFEYAKNRFEAGVSNSFEFNQVKLRYQNTEVEVVRAKYDLLFKLKLLELYYTGKIQDN